MANAHDSALVERFLQLPPAGYLPFLLAEGPAILDHACYWQLVAAAWIGSGRQAAATEWRQLFTADRPHRWKLMKKRDRAVWRVLPQTIRAWRAVIFGENVRAALSWTLDRQKAEHFARSWNRLIVEDQIAKHQVVAYFDRRGERELVVLRG